MVLRELRGAGLGKGVAEGEALGSRGHMLSMPIA